MLPTENAGDTRETAEGKWGETIQYFPRRLIVKLKTPTDATEAVAMAGEAEAVAADAGGTLVRPPSHTGRLVIELGEGAKALDAAKKFTKRADVEYAEPDVIDRAQFVSERHAATPSSGRCRRSRRQKRGTSRPARRPS